MSKSPIDIVTEPDRFLLHADRIIQAANISLEKKQAWVVYHLTALAGHAATGGEMLVPHICALEKLGKFAQMLSALELKERARERAIAENERNAEKLAEMADIRDKLTAMIQAEKIARLREANRVRQYKLEAERANRAVCFTPGKAAWWRMARNLWPAQDFSCQGAD